MATWDVTTTNEPALKTVLVNREEYEVFLETVAAMGWELVPLAGCMGVKRGPEQSRSGRVSLVVTDNVVRLDVERRAA